MNPISAVFPDATRLLAVPPESLAGFFLIYFKHLPWVDPIAVRRCVRHWSALYPLEDRDAVVEALMQAWEYLVDEGSLPPRGSDAGTVSAPVGTRTICITV